jgi:hypothetical protein
VTVPTDLVPLAQVLSLHAASRKMASILTAIWRRKTATADVPISTWPEPPIYQGQEPERVSDDPPSSLEIEEGGGIVQISDDGAWLRFGRGLECYAGDGFTRYSVAFVIPVHEPSAAWPTNDTAADTGLPRGYLERLRWIGDEALAMFQAWFFEEAAAGRLELWGAPGSELAGLKRIEPYALGTGSLRAIIDFTAATLTTATSGDVVYALHVRRADQVQTKAPRRKQRTQGSQTWKCWWSACWARQNEPTPTTN